MNKWEKVISSGMREDYRALNPMAVWMLPKDEPGLRAVERLKSGIVDLSRLPKTSSDINNFRAMQRAASQSQLMR